MTMKLYVCSATLLLLLSLTVVLSSQSTEKPSPATLLEEANRAYAGGNYDQAIPLYRGIIGQSGFSSEILHNLGNSYAENGQTGLAVLQYHRALSLAPGDDDLRGSLESVRNKSGLFDPEQNELVRFFNRIHMNQWAKGVTACLTLLTLVLVIHTFYPLKRGLLPFCLVTVVLLTICGAGTVIQYFHWNRAIVIRTDVRLLMSPFPGALSQGILDEGSWVKKEKNHGNYLYVQDEKGRLGWIISGAVEQITASHTTYLTDSAEQ